MSYQLNKTDGTLLTSLIDGQIDQASTNLTLVGKNYTGYGEAFNENFIKLLENFSNTSAPSNPLTGQLWWDTSNARLKVYTGTQAKELSLIDIIGTFDYSVKLISQRLNSDSKLELFYFKDENGSFFDLINSIYTFFNPINLDVFPLPQFSLYYGAN